jgi:hypothetical protein
VQLLRSAGNLLLPFAYGVAIERRQITAATPLEDSLGNHAPTHPDDRLWVSARSALAEGLAEPGQVVTRLAGDTLAERLRLADIELPRSGPPDLNLLQLAGLYRALASGGQWLAPHLTLAPERPQRRLLRAEAGFIVGDILALRDADGAAQPFVLRQYVPDGRETVLAAFSERYTLALWAAGPRPARPGGGAGAGLPARAAAQPGAAAPAGARGRGVGAGGVRADHRERAARVVHPRHRDRAGGGRCAQPAAHPVSGRWRYRRCAGAGRRPRFPGAFRSRPGAGRQLVASRRRAPERGAETETETETETAGGWPGARWRGAICSS